MSERFVCEPLIRPCVTAATAQYAAFTCRVRRLLTGFFVRLCIMRKRLMGLRVTAATLEECVSFQLLSEAAFQSCTGARAEVIINLRCPLSQELFVEHLTASKWIGQGKNDGKGLSWRQRSVFQGEQSFVSLREPMRAVWQKHRVQCSLLIWGLSPVKGCWENKMEIQGPVDKRRGCDDVDV